MTELSENILRLREQGLSYREIQKELNCSKGTIAYHCNNTTKAKISDRSRQQRLKVSQMISEYKEESGCVDCGGAYPYFVLQFDHRSPLDKGFAISRWKDHVDDIGKVMEEIEKCDVVCANCHAFRTQAYHRSEEWKIRLQDRPTSTI